MNNSGSQQNSNATKVIQVAGLSFYCTIGGAMLAFAVFAIALAAILGLGFIGYVAIHLVAAF